MSGQEAIEIAKKVAEDQGWPWIEPAMAEYRRPWFGKGGWWDIRSKTATIGGDTVYVRIDDATGEVMDKQYFRHLR